MAAKSYYLVLGVSPDESPSGIRSAFRELAKRYHPDRGGPEAEGRFREIAEAYEVLSDPRRRGLYDRTLRRRGKPREPPAAEPVRGSAAPSSRVWPEPEPLRERRPAGRGVIEPIDERGEPPVAVRLEVVLSPEEARRGVILPIALPVLRECADCGGFARRSRLPCIGCGGTGVVAAEERFGLKLDPPLASGTMFDVPIEGWGGSGGRLRIHVEVVPDPS